MNKVLSITLILLITVLAACGNTSENKTSTTNVQESTGEYQGKPSDKNKKSEEDVARDAQEEDNKSNQGEADSEMIDPQYEINEHWSIVPINENSHSEVVLLTIDDAPDNYGLEMARKLKELDAPAIFFVNGHFIDTPEKQEELREIHNMGFMIGNHTFNHAYLPDLTEEEQKEEIIRLNDLVEEIIGERPVFFRAPHGANTEYTKDLVKEEGMVLMNWSYGYDWESDYQSKDELAHIMVNTELLGNGSNLLMHDREWTSEALEDIVEGLRDKGYETVDPNLIKID